MSVTYLMFGIPALLIVISAVKQSYFARWELLRVLMEHKKKNREWVSAKELLAHSGFSVTQRNIQLVLDRLIKDGNVVAQYPTQRRILGLWQNTYKYVG